jgi:hypothetical protein
VRLSGGRERLFHAALGGPPGGRVAFLAQIDASDEELRRD